MVNRYQCISYEFKIINKFVARGVAYVEGELYIWGIEDSFEKSYNVQTRQILGYFYGECKSSIYFQLEYL